jgi:hypothetical protein
MSPGKRSYLRDFGIEERVEVREPRFDAETQTVRCPCRYLVTAGRFGTAHISPERFVADVISESLDSDDPLPVRGWTCSECSRVLVETLEHARDCGQLNDLKRAWYPVRVALDAPDRTAVTFTPKVALNERLSAACVAVDDLPRGAFR